MDIEAASGSVPRAFTESTLEVGGDISIGLSCDQRIIFSIKNSVLQISILTPSIANFVDVDIQPNEIRVVNEVLRIGAEIIRKRAYGVKTPEAHSGQGEVPLTC